jgi:putative oxidoreductase
MKRKILLVLNALLGLIFINSGLNKFFNYLPMPEEIPAKMAENFEAFMTIGWLMPLIAVVEIVGGFLCLTRKYRTLGSVMLLPIMVGILLTHLLVAPDGLIIAFVLFAILLWNLIEDRAKIQSLWN